MRAAAVCRCCRLRLLCCKVVLSLCVCRGRGLLLLLLLLLRVYLLRLLLVLDRRAEGVAKRVSYRVVRRRDRR